jgi:predicted HTH transcriptional regulator
VNYSESVHINPDQLRVVKKLVAGGESLHVEFKRKAAHPEKIVRELIAFANTDGGYLLIGVDDDGSVPGVKYPEEEWLGVRTSLRKHCRPPLQVNPTTIRISEKKYVVMLGVKKSSRRPHRFMVGQQFDETYVRVADKSIKASREMREIIRLSKNERNTHFSYGDAEKLLMQHLAIHPTITLQDFKKIARLSSFHASQKLITLVLAKVLAIIPTDKGDLYRRQP